MDRTETVLDVVAEVSGRNRSEVTLEQDLVADLEIDSPKALQLLVQIEEKLEIEIPDEAAARFEKVRDLVEFVT
ncbi:MAG: phosphopantetheine-binding protein [Planctomycetota bacterium]